MKFQFSTKKGVTLLAIMVLMVLPSCTDWIKSKLGLTKQATPSTATSAPEVAASEQDVLVSMDGKPLITINTLQSEKENLINSNPQLRQMIAFMDPKQLDRNLTEGLTNQAIVDKYISDNAIDQSENYQQELERMTRSVKHMLNTKFFSEKLSVNVSDSDAKDFYEKNKVNMPNLLISHGGTSAMGVQFDTQAAAKTFADSVKQNGGDIKKAADKAKLADKLQDFKVVNEQSIGLDTTLRDQILAIANTPSTQVLKDSENGFWVVSATGKQEAQYRAFDEIKTELKQYLEKEKRAEALEQEIGKLKDQYKVVIKEEYFAPTQSAQQETESISVEDMAEQQ